MKEIEAILLSCWSSLVNGVDITRASRMLYVRHMEEINKVKKDNTLLEEFCSSFEEDLSTSTSLMQESLVELKKYKDIPSNAPTIHGRLEHLVSRIEEQIKKNEE